jgi:hypothetical protein
MKNLLHGKASLPFFQKGQTIIEAVVALMTILLIITAIAIVIVNGLYNSQFIKSQNEANKLAQQGIEFVKNIQINDLGTFADLVLDDDGISISSSTFCIDEQNNTLTSNGCVTEVVNTASYFNRTITFFPPGAECNSTEVKVTSTVSWSSTKCPSTKRFCHESKLVGCLPFNLPASNP